MKLRSTITYSIFLSALLITTLAVSMCAQKNAAPTVLQQDKGKFSILRDGKAVGKEEFEIAPIADNG